MAQRQTSYKPEPMVTQFTDAYIYHPTSRSLTKKIMIYFNHASLKLR